MKKMDSYSRLQLISLWLNLVGMVGLDKEEFDYGMCYKKDPNKGSRGYLSKGKTNTHKIYLFTQCRPYFTVLVNNVVHPSEFSYTNIHKSTAKISSISGK